MALRLNNLVENHALLRDIV